MSEEQKQSDSYLFTDAHIPTRAVYPVVDAHNHMWADLKPEEILAVTKEVGVISYCNLTPSLRFSWLSNRIAARQVDFRDFFHDFCDYHPGRFYGFTEAKFDTPADEPLFNNAKRFVDETVELLKHHVALRARGLKVPKTFGLNHRDADGNLVAADDPRLASIWETAADLGVPVLIHHADPCAFFEPCTPRNEQYGFLAKYPDWRLDDSQKFPRKEELLRRRDALLRQHPRTTFILAHMGSFPENLAYVSNLLVENSNTFVDISLCLAELGRQPYAAREFFIKHQDRILFGTDMIPSVEVYRCHFRFLETFDEYFVPPDYDGTFSRHSWRIYGIALTKEVLAKIYYQNALRIVPGLKDDLKEILPADCTQNIRSQD